ncbi:MAG TPA: hypothetical protein VHY08_22505 [Bacillota bacterium]|nr:hypothetical protein [Bacillota bacterium]
MNDDQLALIKYRMEQAERTLHEAELLAQYSEWNGVINRAYYSMLRSFSFIANQGIRGFKTHRCFGFN